MKDSFRNKSFDDKSFDVGASICRDATVSAGLEWGMSRHRTRWFQELLRVAITSNESAGACGNHNTPAA